MDQRPRQLLVVRQLVVHTQRPTCCLWGSDGVKGCTDIPLTLQNLMGLAQCHWRCNDTHVWMRDDASQAWPSAQQPVGAHAAASNQRLLRLQARFTTTKGLHHSYCLHAA